MANRKNDKVVSYKVIGEIIEYCKKNNVVSFAELMDYAIEFRYHWFKVLCGDGGFIVIEYLKSKNTVEK